MFARDHSRSTSDTLEMSDDVLVVGAIIEVQIIMQIIGILLCKLSRWRCILCNFRLYVYARFLIR